MGIKYAVANDFSVGSMLLLSCLTVAVCFFFRQWLDVLVIFVATGLMLITELFNTAIEELCDFVEPRFNDRIGVVKDVSSAAVGIGILVWAVTLAVEVGRLLQARTPQSQHVMATPITFTFLSALFVLTSVGVVIEQRYCLQQGSPDDREAGLKASAINHDLIGDAAVSRPRSARDTDASRGLSAPPGVDLPRGHTGLARIIP